METQIAYKIHTQEGPLPLARQLLVNFEHNRGGHREILPPKLHIFGLYEKPKEAVFRYLHKSTLRDHAPHSSRKHIFMKNIRKYKKSIENHALNDTCTKGTAGGTRNSYPKGPPMPLVWEK